ncbi:formate hydrogenlyase maturation HycH family protein [Ferrimonas lipolytica]|uniref:HycH family protein n=1 Tax=Ferrimonas lipolytica TaxID=2724191 RepID=A0A6H1UC68_9GAMM|nr:formate hydrogenlyase maturation HycH family protein [Ferrimonas lipolytica]QIZ76239.1 HycH family protein [Ferrimonas lipolytica]
MEEQVYIYALNRRFVDEQDMPEEAQQVMYYSLAIGHHLGVVDCLKVRLQCSLDEYRDWIGLLPKESIAAHKMSRYFTFGEIAIYQEHVDTLARAFSEVGRRPNLSERQRALTDTMMGALADIRREPNMYLMVRSR